MAQYLKPDTELGYIENSAEIQFQKFNNLRHTILGCMLGDFNDVGSYVVSPEITKELIEMEKYIVESYDNIELCKSALRLDKQISFMVTFEGNKATLSLIEKINYEANFALNSGTYSNINEYVLDEVETSGEINRNVLYYRWNIKAVPGAIIDIFNCEPEILEKYFGIVNRFKYILEANKVLLENEEKIEESEAIYVNEIFTILEAYPKLKKQIEKEIKETLSEKKNSVSINKPYFAKTINEIVESSIERNISTLNAEEKQRFIQEKNTAILKSNIAKENIINIEHIKDDNEQKSETSPTVVRMAVLPVYQSKTIEDLGKDLISANNESIKAKTKEDAQLDLITRTTLAIGEKKGQTDEVLVDIKSEKNSEVEKMIEKLVMLGVAKEIGAKEKDKKVSVVVSDVEQKKVAPKQEAKKQAAPSKQDVKAKSDKPAAKKPTATKPVKQKVEKSQEKTKQTPDSATDKTVSKTSITRIFSLKSSQTMGDGLSQNPQPNLSQKQQDELGENDLRLKLKRTNEKNVERFIEKKVNQETHTKVVTNLPRVVGETETDAKLSDGQPLVSDLTKSGTDIQQQDDGTSIKVGNKREVVVEMVTEEILIEHLNM